MKARSQDAPTISDFLQLYKADGFVWESPAFSAHDSRTWLTTPTSSGIENNLSFELSIDTSSPGTELSEVSGYFDREWSDRTSTPPSSCGSSFSEYFDACSCQDFVGDLFALEDDSHQVVNESLDGIRYSTILEWLTLLFVDVVNAELQSTDPGLSNYCGDENTYEETSLEGEIKSLTSIFDVEEEDYGSRGLETQSMVPLELKDRTKPVVKLAAHDTLFAPACAVKSATVEGDKSADWTCTSKSISMWGRRLERIPKVRVPGQKEAVYCFDESRKSKFQLYRTRPVHQGRANSNFGASFGEDVDRFRFPRDPYEYRQNTRPKLGSRSNTYSGNTNEKDTLQRREYAHPFSSKWSMDAAKYVLPHFSGGGVLGDPMASTLRRPQSPWVFSLPRSVF
ncbi:hypothetical protein SCHPADRAFT_940057 [Schizopora paradoxa]|uniref:Uncharacterized protein n=1 Tax=Schizopora paradoxa TaxID=27342 RepID=A0A0H2SAE5_9AGAM|nr:hypothetical protein SCHPADRAFT_940057 [Schizopora paradoxa]